MKTLSFSAGFLLNLVASTLLVANTARADDTRARADYMIHCQGCHVGDGRGFPGRVPDLRHSLPLLLSVEGGRAFLVQVPGSSQANLSNDRLANTLNWMVKQFSTRETETAFPAYTAEEVSIWRKRRLEDVLAVRHTLIGHLEIQATEIDGGGTPK